MKKMGKNQILEPFCFDAYPQETRLSDMAGFLWRLEQTEKVLGNHPAD